MTRPRLVVGTAAALAACSGRSARAPAAPPSNTLEPMAALAPCVPELRSAHLAVTGSVGTYQVGVLAVAVSPDHQTIATARTDGILQIIDVGSGTVQCIAGANVIALSSDARWAAGLTLAGAAWDDWYEVSQAGLTRWDLQRGKEISSVDVETPMHPAAAVSMQGIVAVGGNSESDPDVLLWDHGEVHALDTGWPPLPAFSPDGTRLVIASNERPVDLYAAPDWQPAGTVDRPPASAATRYDRPDAIAVGPSVVAFAGPREGGHPIEVWQPGAKGPRFTLAPPDELEMADARHRFRFAAMALSPTEDVLAVLIHDDPQVRRYDAHTGKPLASLPLIDGWPAALAYSADGRWLVVAGDTGRLVIFDAQSGDELARSPEPAPAPAAGDLPSRVLSPDGTRAAAAYAEGNPSRSGVRIWDVPTGTILRDLPAGDDVLVANVAFSPDGRWLVSVESGTTSSRFGTVRLWDGRTGEAIDALPLDALRSTPTRVDFAGDRAVRVTMRGGVLSVAIED